MTIFLRKYGIWLLAGVTFLLFLPAVTYEIIYFMDDSCYVFANPDLRLELSAIKKLLTTPYIGLYTPLQMASYLIDYAIAGLKPWIYHLHNILWHVLAVYFVWRFFRELGVKRFTALCCAAAFAIHPQRVESVVWIAERKDVLATTFFTASMCFFLYSRRHGKKASITAPVCMLAAMMSKPQALVLPAVLYLLEVHRTRRWFTPEHLKAVLPYGLLSILYGFAVGDMVKSSTNSVIDDTRPRHLIAVHMIYNYLRFAGKTFCPAGMVPLYPFIIFSKELIVMSFAGLAAVLAALAAVWHRNRSFFLYDLLPMLLCFGGILLPVSGIILFSNADFADRYSYIPSIFLWGAAGLALDRIRWHKLRYSMAAIAIYLAILAVASILYMPSWKNNTAVLTASSAVANPAFTAIVCLSGQQFYNNSPAEAMKTVEKLSLDSFRSQRAKNFIVYYYTLTNALSGYMQGNTSLLQDLRILTAPHLLEPMLNDNFPETMVMILKLMAKAEIHSKNIPGAIAVYTRISNAKSVQPFAVEFYRGVAAMLKKDPATAISFFQKALHLNPDDENTIRNLDMAKKQLEEQQNNGR